MPDDYESTADLPLAEAVEAAAWHPADDWEALSGEAVQVVKAELADEAAVQAAIAHGDMPPRPRVPPVVVALAMLTFQLPTLFVAILLAPGIRTITSYRHLSEIYHEVGPWKWLVEGASFLAAFLPILLCMFAFARAWTHLGRGRHKMAMNYSLLPITAIVLSPILMGVTLLLISNVTALW